MPKKTTTTGLTASTGTRNWDSLDALRDGLGMGVDDTPPDARSVSDFAHVWKCSSGKAARDVMSLTRAGGLQSGETVRGGRRMRVYWPA